LSEHLELVGDRYTATVLGLKKRIEELKPDVFPKNSVNKKEHTVHPNEEKLTQEVNLLSKALRNQKKDFEKF